MWFDCANYVLSDLHHHSGASLAYLKANASTQYTLDEFKNARSQEYIPRSIAEAKKEVVLGDGQYSMFRAEKIIRNYLVDIKAMRSLKPIPKIISLDQRQSGQRDSVIN